MSKQLDMNNVNHQLIMAALTGMVDEGLSPHEVFEVLEDIKRKTFHALLEISQGRA
ncbi:hypothetical protein M5X02_23940 [Paenibacillus alvei]|uniref:hypothetical protein n=1 Tax=Paenibacillus alvei TaxID=44250 RepID=UPI000288001A|nr:hypothetical protein [Paenibacillus alvei]EJW14826.1 hypothetical protein PAV_11c01670 [Paenibacillus alvei DSM 29]MCY9543692.1 hypothetical protein [Paenibacillus alvei]MCY9708530.1 hypothetical protein [Paenibacillus alvei]MEC0083231.1 hypothetical protein [Paenibacillus alvei]